MSAETYARRFNALAYSLREDPAATGERWSVCNVCGCEADDPHDPACPVGTADRADAAEAECARLRATEEAMGESDRRGFAHHQWVCQERDTLRAENERLRALLASTVEHESTSSHSHEREGTWDADNRRTIASKPCERCHTFADAREALGRPRWPASRRIDHTTPDTCDHRPDCGCGQERR